MDITVMSYMEVTPAPMLVKISLTAIAPVATPAITEVTVPTISTTKTFIPTRAPTSTRIYGTTCHILYSPSSTCDEPCMVMTKYIIALTTAAGRTILKFILNLSLISQP